tara:strand:- start:3844 stop:4755 length:912 start_codon:yes stop_codon:yes gene_type:complete
MKKFLWKGVLFTSLLLLVFLCFEFLVFPNNKNVYSIKYKLLQDQGIEVIVAGNSHLGFSIVSDSLSFTSVNIANKARQLETDIDILLQDDLFKKKYVKHILIPISYYSLFNQLKENNSYHSSQMRLYYNFYKIEAYSQGIYKNSLLLNEPFRELFEDSFFLNYTKKNPFSKKGWRANDVLFSKDSGIHKKINNLEIAVYNKETIRYNLGKIKQLLLICQKNNIQLHLVLPPYSSYYYSFTNNKYNTLIKGLLKDLTDSDYCNLIDSNQFMSTHIEYYENTDHLNAVGAILYTQKIDSILKRHL